MMSIEYRDPRTLKDHPAQRKVYGDGADAELIESVGRRGVVEPIGVLRDGTIYSGHRRKEAAIKCGRNNVPCVVNNEIDPPDDVESGDVFLEANVQRVKTVEQKAREFEYRKEIEGLRAKRSQQEAGGDKKSANHKAKSLASKLDATGRRAPTAADIAAKDAGFGSRQSAGRALEAVKEIDKAAESGDEEKAAKIRDALNNKSIHAATVLATGKSWNDSRTTKKTEKRDKKRKRKTQAVEPIIPPIPDGFNFEAARDELEELIGEFVKERWPWSASYYLTKALMDFAPKAPQFIRDKT